MEVTKTPKNRLATLGSLLSANKQLGDYPTSRPEAAMDGCHRPKWESPLADADELVGAGRFL